MSEQINKVLANTAQQFTTAEQLQARTNIGAVWTGDMTGYVSYSVIDGDTATSAITSINGSSIGGGGGDTSNCFPKTASALLQPVGDYLSSTDSALFYPYTGNPSGFINSSEQVVTAISDDGVYITSINGKGLSGAGGTGGGGDQVVTATGGTSTYVTSINGSAISGIAPLDSATVSAIASSYAESAASSKLDSTAQVVTATGWNGTYITSINGVGLSGAGGGGGGTSIEYSGIAPVVVDNTASSISLTNIPLDVDYTLTAYSDDGTIYFGLANSAEYMRSGDMTDYQLTANMSSYQLTSNMSLYQLTSNMSSYQQTADMSAYQKTADMSGYFQTSAPLIPYSALEYSGATTIITGISGSSLGASQFANPIKVVYGSGLQTSVSSDADDNKTLIIEASANMGGFCTHVVWGMASVWTASAVDQVLPYGSYMGSPYGFNPYYIHWNAVLEAPYAARFDLCESADSRNGSPYGELVLDSCYVQPGNSAFVHLNGVSYGWGNNLYMRNAYIKVHWDENPLNAVLNIHAQNGYWCDLCQGTTIGPVLTYPYNP